MTKVAAYLCCDGDLHGPQSPADWPSTHAVASLHLLARLEELVGNSNPRRLWRTPRVVQVIGNHSLFTVLDGPYWWVCHVQEASVLE